MIMQIDLLTKHVMGALVKLVNVVISKSYEDDKESKKPDEEIWYLENYPRVSLRLLKERWEPRLMDHENDHDMRDKDCDYECSVPSHDQAKNKEPS